jgi:membrane AbrB-like protein
MRFQLVLCTIALVALFFLAKLPAAVLLGAMAAAMIVAGRGAQIKLPAGLFPIAQAVIGCMIARSLTSALWTNIWHHLTLFLSVTLVVLCIATLLGIGLARLRVLPGTTALWGAFPGAAAVMVVMSESYGADMRLVAFMQYLRVVVVAVMASLVSRLIGIGGTDPHIDWLAAVAWLPFGKTLVLIAIGGLIGPRLPLASAPLLGTMLLAAALQDLAGWKIELPQPFLAVCYVIVGWTVGLRFTREVFTYATRALPRVLASICTLVALCAGVGFALARLGHIDLLTAYFATSPGGADSIAILTAGSTVDVPLVMSIQIGRSIAVMLFGPALARFAATHALPPSPALSGPSTKAT